MQELGGKRGRRLLVVANRLPVNVSFNQDDGSIQTTMSCGGLVCCLKALSKSVHFRWFGWPGTDTHRNDQEQVREQLESQYDAVPIFLNSQDAENHYNGFSNSVLWPLLHGLPDRAKFHEDWEKAYIRVNKRFADTIIPHVQDGDMIWIHDYHLLLLPRFLRDGLIDKKDVRIGLFLHTPFPSEDAFAILPLREEICDGLMSCDLMGFHNREYVDAFLNGAEELLAGVRRTPRDLHYGERELVVKDFPLGIEPEKFNDSLASEEVKQQISILREAFRGTKLIVGVDRLDYTKGLPQKLYAFDRFLKDNPEWSGKVVLVQLCIPSRSTVPEYVDLRREVEEMVGRINGNHGTTTWTPVKYIHQSMNEPALHALYAASDVCMVAPIRDGLDLVSYEYVASQRQTANCGVLMLSKYTGASRMLESALTIDPWDTPRFSEDIARALAMTEEERNQRMESARKVVEEWTSTRWGLSFLEALQSEVV